MSADNSAASSMVFRKEIINSSTSVTGSHGPSCKTFRDQVVQFHIADSDSANGSPPTLGLGNLNFPMGLPDAEIINAESWQRSSSGRFAVC